MTMIADDFDDIAMRLDVLLDREQAMRAMVKEPCPHCDGRGSIETPGSVGVMFGEPGWFAPGRRDCPACDGLGCEAMARERRAYEVTCAAERRRKADLRNSVAIPTEPGEREALRAMQMRTSAKLKGMPKKVTEAFAEVRKVLDDAMRGRKFVTVTLGAAADKLAEADKDSNFMPGWVSDEIISDLRRDRTALAFTVQGRPLSELGEGLVSSALKSRFGWDDIRMERYEGQPDPTISWRDPRTDSRGAAFLSDVAAQLNCLDCEGSGHVECHYSPNPPAFKRCERCYNPLDLPSP